MGQERVAAGCGKAGRRELPFRPRLEPLLDQARDRVAAEGAGTDRRALGLVEKGLHQRLVDTRLRDARRDREQRRDSVQARREVHEPAQRGAIGPVDVVDCDQERRADSEVRRQPVEAVQRRIRGVEARRGPAVGSGQLEQRCRKTSGTLEQLTPFAFVDSRQARLEQLAGGPEGEVALQLRAPRAQHFDAVVAGALLQRCEQSRLADAGGADEGEHSPLA
jgi:hypothetical protein